MIHRAALLSILAVLVLGCDGGSSKTPELDTSSVPQPDSRVDGAAAPETGAVQDGSAPACGAEIYPCAPYGTAVGTVIENHRFQGFRDPGDLCQANDQKTVDKGQLVPLSLQTFHRWDGGCPEKKKKLLWVLGSAAWCGTCLKEVKAVQEAYAKNQLDDRVAFFNVVVDGQAVGSAPDEAVTKLWIDAVKASFPVAFDAQRTMTKYFTASYFPLNMLVDLSTMKIYYVKNGDSLQIMATKIQQFFGSP